MHFGGGKKALDAVQNQWKESSDDEDHRRAKYGEWHRSDLCDW